jgi:hypothetical protein
LVTAAIELAAIRDTTYFPILLSALKTHVYLLQKQPYSPFFPFIVRMNKGTAAVSLFKRKADGWVVV